MSYYYFYFFTSCEDPISPSRLLFPPSRSSPLVCHFPRVLPDRYFHIFFQCGWTFFVIYHSEKKFFLFPFSKCERVGRVASI